MTGPGKYGYAHRQIRKRLSELVEAGDAYCSEAECVMPSRWIPPGSAWDVCHDPSGVIVVGPGHSKCNRREGAARGNRMRGRSGPQTSRRWVL